MKYQVIARKFRPQVFDEVVGQDPIVRTLKNAIEMDRIGHAYLFSGPRGVGKTTTARLLAKALNCSQGPTATPCNNCASCQEISRGQSIDVLEIDAASNTGVDSIRELRDNARYAPSRDRFKIFIVDEVHMLSNSAFNALLKILEEPPEHIAFIMATTEKHKLPATILSRCQQFVFRTIPAAQILEHLRTIASHENVKIGDGALDYVVKAAEGSMRDAQSLLDQVIAFGGQEIADEDVRNVLGFVPSDILDKAVEALAERNSRALLDVVEIVVEQGLNLQQFVREFLARIRDLLLAKLGIGDKILASPEERAQIFSQSERFSEQDLIRFFDMLLHLENDLRWTSEPRFHLEVGCIKLAKVGQLRDIEEVIRDLKREGVPARNSAARQRTESGVKKTDPPLRKKEKEETTSEGTVPKLAGQPTASRLPLGKSPGKEATQETSGAAGESAAASFTDEYRQLVEEKSPTTALYLGRAESIRHDQDRVQIQVPSQKARAALESQEHRQILEDAAAQLLGKPISVSLIIDEASQGSGDAGQNDSVEESVQKEALVQSFLDVFQGEIAQVKRAKKPQGE